MIEKTIIFDPITAAFFNFDKDYNDVLLRTIFNEAQEEFKTSGFYSMFQLVKTLGIIDTEILKDSLNYYWDKSKDKEVNIQWSYIFTDVMKGIAITCKFEPKEER